MKLTLRLKDYSMMVVSDTESSVLRDLSDHFTFEVPGAKFMPVVKQGRWDGKIRMLNRQNGEINVGLYQSIVEWAEAKGHEIILEANEEYGLPTDTNHLGDLSDFITSLNLPFKPRDYQLMAFVHALKKKRAILLSPTGSGKSMMIYMLMRWYRSQANAKKVLVIVPTTSLVEQMVADFEDYGFDTQEHVHKIYSGKDKKTDKAIVVTTWQSIYKLGPRWFKDYGCIFGDEVHGFKSKSLSSIMNKAVDAEYRFGTTGTLDGTQVHQLVLEGLFGPVKRVTTTAKLQEVGQLAPLDIDIIQLGYETQEKILIEGATYHEEIDFLVSHNRRNQFICDLTYSLSGNTLVLFNLVEKHGKVLQTMLGDLMADNPNNEKTLFYVSGETKSTDREQIRNIIDRQKNGIVLASLGTFSTGINIKNIHNIVFASPSKAQIRVLQSIGRGLRVSEDGRETRLYDLADDLRVKSTSKPNFTLTHCGERIRIYKSESFKFNVRSRPV